MANQQIKGNSSKNSYFLNLKLCANEQNTKGHELWQVNSYSWAKIFKEQ